MASSQLLIGYACLAIIFDGHDVQAFSCYTGNSDGVSYHCITVIVVTFYFCRLHQYLVNSDHVDA